MQQPPSTENPVQWSTLLVLAWMRSYDDSKEDVKKKILEVIEANDIDGLTLKHIRGDSEEIYTLFPSLKERLTFKAMLREIFKDTKCANCHSNGGSNSACNHETPPPCKQTPPATTTTQSPTQQQQQQQQQHQQHGPKVQNSVHTASSHRSHAIHVHTNHAHSNHAHANQAHSEEASLKSPSHLSRMSPLLSPRPHPLPRQDSKETTPVSHMDPSVQMSRAKMLPVVGTTPHVLSPRDRDLAGAHSHMQRFIAPQGMPAGQLLTHGATPGGPGAMYPFAPIAGQFSPTVANQALVAALTARALPHQQAHQQHQQHQQQLHHQQQQQKHMATTVAGGQTSPAATSRGPIPPSHSLPQRPGTSSAASQESVSTAAATASRIVEIIDKEEDNIDIPASSSTSVTSHSQGRRERRLSTSPSESPGASTSAGTQSAPGQVPVTMPLIGTRGRPATKGAIRSAKISQKYKKIIQRMKSAHKQVIEIPYPAPLPSFSQLLRQQIGRGNIANFRSRFTYECAQYYMSLNPTPSHTEYRNISKTVVENFPVLSSPDEDVPWRKFNNQLSQAIRNIRRQLRSVPNSGYPPAQKRKYWRNLASQFMCQSNSALALTHLSQQHQQQLAAGSSTSGLAGGDPHHGYNGLNDQKNNNFTADDVIFLKDENDDDDDDDGNRDRKDENDDQDDGIDDEDGDEEDDECDEDPRNFIEEDDGDVTAAEWANKRE